jgi:hypothetical protein
VDEVGVPDDVEALDDAALREPALDLLAAGIGMAKGQRRRLARRKDQRIGRVDDDLSGQVFRAGQAKSILGSGPQRRQGDQLPEGGRVREAPSLPIRDPGAGLLPPASRDPIFTRVQAGGTRAPRLPASPFPTPIFIAAQYAKSRAWDFDFVGFDIRLEKDHAAWSDPSGRFALRQRG